MAAELPIHAVQPEAGKCPIDHSQFSRQKTAIKVDPSTLPIERDAKGVWHIRGFHEARSILRGTDTQQGGLVRRIS